MVGRPTFRRLSAALAGILFLGASCAAPKPIVLGFIGELSGNNADIGEAGRNGVLLAIERANAAGGIRGRRVELALRDDHSTEEGARAAIGELTALGAEAIIGPFNTAMADAALPEAERAGALLVSPTVSAQKFVGLDDAFVRLNSSTRDNAGAYAEFLATRRGAPRVALAFDLRNRAFAESWTEEFMATYARLGGTAAGMVPFDGSMETGYGDAVRELIALRPECAVFVANAVDSARLAQLFRRTDKKALLVAAEWAATKQLIELGGSDVEGMIELQTFDDSSGEASWKGFKAEFVERFLGEPSFAAVAAYDAAAAVLAAFSSRKPGQSLKEALLSGGPYQGLQQSIAFDRFGDTVRNKTFTAIVGGAYVKVE